MEKIVKICAVGDMHGQLANVFQAIDESKPELLLCCGDWGDPGKLDHAQFREILSHVHVLSVYGNHDDIPFLSTAANSDGSPVILQPGEVVERDGLKFAGISGIWAKSHAQPYYVTDDDVAAQASALESSGVDVLLSHGCPVGIADTLPGGRHGGQRCFLDAFHAIDPRERGV